MCYLEVIITIHQGMSPLFPLFCHQSELNYCLKSTTEAFYANHSPLARLSLSATLASNVTKLAVFANGLEALISKSWTIDKLALTWSMLDPVE
jgi:hypothetical protein